MLPARAMARSTSTLWAMTSYSQISSISLKTMRGLPNSCAWASVIRVSSRLASRRKAWPRLLRSTGERLNVTPTAVQVSIAFSYVPLRLAGSRRTRPALGSDPGV